MKTTLKPTDTLSILLPYNIAHNLFMMLSTNGLMNDGREAKLEKLLHENNITFLSDSDINRMIEKLSYIHSQYKLYLWNNKFFIDEEYTLTLNVEDMYNLGVIIGNISASEFKRLYTDSGIDNMLKFINDTISDIYDAIYSLFGNIHTEPKGVISTPIVFEKRKLETTEDMKEWCFKNPLKIVGTHRFNQVAIKTQNDVNNLIVGFARDMNGFTFTHVLQECKYTTDENTQEQTWIHYSQIDAIYQ